MKAQTKPRPQIIDIEPHLSSRSEDAGDATPVRTVEYGAMLGILCGASSIVVPVVAYYASPRDWLAGGISNAPILLGTTVVAIPSALILAWIYVPAKIRIGIERIHNHFARATAKLAFYGLIAFALVCAIGLPIIVPLFHSAPKAPPTPFTRAATARHALPAPIQHLSPVAVLTPAKSRVAPLLRHLKQLHLDTKPAPVKRKRQT